MQRNAGAFLPRPPLTTSSRVTSAGGCASRSRRAGRPPLPQSRPGTAPAGASPGRRRGRRGTRPDAKTAARRRPAGASVAGAVEIKRRRHSASSVTSCAAPSLIIRIINVRLRPNAQVERRGRKGLPRVAGGTGCAGGAPGGRSKDKGSRHDHPPGAARRPRTRGPGDAPGAPGARRLLRSRGRCRRQRKEREGHRRSHPTQKRGTRGGGRAHWHAEGTGRPLTDAAGGDVGRRARHPRRSGDERRSPAPRQTEDGLTPSRPPGGGSGLVPGLHIQQSGKERSASTTEEPTTDRRAMQFDVLRM